MKNEVSRFKASTVFEGMTSIRAVIKAADEGISDRRITEILFDTERRRAKEKEISYLEAVSSRYGFKVLPSSKEELDSVTVGSSHGGIVARCTDRTVPSLTENDVAKNGFYVMIEGIEDPYNFGYAIRSIYAAGCNGIVLTPRNWMSAAGVVCRSSAGASEMIPLFTATPDGAVDIFKRCGYKVAAAGIRDSVSAYDADLKYPIFLIVGGEKRGISRSTLDRCDTVVRLDYGRRFNASLSAASAASILSYEILRQNRDN